MYEKVRINGKIVGMAVLVVCDVDENGRRDIIAAEPMTEESEDPYIRLVTTYLMEHAEDWSVSRAYLSKESIAAMLKIAV